MRSAPLDELFLQWLYEQVADPDFEDPDMMYWKVLKVLYEKEFVWVVPNDENRITDGKALRDEFLDDLGITDIDPDWMELGCSVLEMMVALSYRLEFEADQGKGYYWFWVFMDNLGLRKYNDKYRRLPRRVIDNKLEDLIFRNYEPSGHGGLFPLENPQHDQRKREIWDQAGEYLLEHGLVG